MDQFSGLGEGGHAEAVLAHVFLKCLPDDSMRMGFMAWADL